MLQYFHHRWTSNTLHARHTYLADDINLVHIKKTMLEQGLKTHSEKSWNVATQDTVWVVWKNVNNKLLVFIIQNWKTRYSFLNIIIIINYDTFLSRAWDFTFEICPDKQKMLICALSASCHVIVNTKGIWFSNSVSLHLAYCNSCSALRCVAFLKFQHVLWYWDTNNILEI